MIIYALYHLKRKAKNTQKWQQNKKSTLPTKTTKNNEYLEEAKKMNGGKKVMQSYLLRALDRRL